MLEYADESLKADREVVLEAVKTYGKALQFADKKLRADRGTGCGEWLVSCAGSCLSDLPRHNRSSDT